ncbi:amino acid ABC transporter permease [Bradyrhizobium diversitatis]|uniref:Amino acid ABC transporter permease n=1 Tax=Bradyrhizobium diversitatis TaxID=2755406 RepID=A0ABS0PCA5_9BRAD|nr:amino acid ABC transporter permease [Bradyrhizobium diversitatis]MBH5390675.1 amino acid ABC transporter permease [Bradyrhizobium diversitatis]
MMAILEYWPVLLKGLWITVTVSLCTIIGGAIGAVIIGGLRLSSSTAVRVATMVFVELWRSPSALVWLFWVYYALPMVTGTRINPLTAAILVLLLEASVYGSEVVRSGLEAVNRGQSDACYALGLNKSQSFIKVVLPQALSQIVPGFGSMARTMFKWTAIVSFIGVQDLLYVSQFVRAQTFETTKVFLLLAVVYWILCLGVAFAFRALEQVLPLNRALRAAQASSSASQLGDNVSAIGAA